MLSMSHQLLSCAAKHCARRMAGASARASTQTLTCTWIHASSTFTAGRHPGGPISTSAVTSTTMTSWTWRTSSPASATRAGRGFIARCPRPRLDYPRLSLPSLCRTPTRTACWETSCSSYPSISLVCASLSSWVSVWLLSVSICSQQDWSRCVLAHSVISCCFSNVQ